MVRWSLLAAVKEGRRRTKKTVAKARGSQFTANVVGAARMVHAAVEQHAQTALNVAVEIVQKRVASHLLVTAGNVILKALRRR